VTDAFSIPFTLLSLLIETGGDIDRETGEEALRRWGKSEWYAPFAGITTRKVVKTLLSDGCVEEWEHAGRLNTKLFKSHYYALSSNGAAVKAWPAALLYPGDPQAAAKAVIPLTMASHDDLLSVSGASAMAAAVSRAFTPGCNVYDMVQAAMDGAKIGESLAHRQQGIRIYPGPSVYKRIRWSVSLCARFSSNAMADLRDLIGNGPAVAESLPAALGLVVAHDGNTMSALYDAVNIGDETSAIASMVGALCGALRGVKSLPEDTLKLIDEANGFNLEELSKEAESLACRI
jgi:ADP-ribosylglycohydrolase